MTVMKITILTWRWPHVGSGIYVRNTGLLLVRARAVPSLRCGATWKTFAMPHDARTFMEWVRRCIWELGFNDEEDGEVLTMEEWSELVRDTVRKHRKGS